MPRKTCEGGALDGQAGLLKTVQSLVRYRVMLFRQLRYTSANAGTEDASSDFMVTVALPALLSTIVSTSRNSALTCGLAYM